MNEKFWWKNIHTPRYLCFFDFGVPQPRLVANTQFFKNNVNWLKNRKKKSYFCVQMRNKRTHSRPAEYHSHRMYVKQIGKKLANISMYRYFNFLNWCLVDTLSTSLVVDVFNILDVPWSIFIKKLDYERRKKFQYLWL